MLHRTLSPNDHEYRYFLAAAKEAERALCRQARCGTVIASGTTVIGQGYNGPPQDSDSQRTCGNSYDRARKPKYDLTCCIHAEWRAIINAAKRSGTALEGSELYFMRIDDDGSFTDAGEPYCTVCSRLALESGIARFWLWNGDGADIYTTEEYNQRSYAYHT